MKRLILLLLCLFYVAPVEAVGLHYVRGAYRFGDETLPSGKKLIVYDEDNAEFVQLYASNNQAYLEMGGTSPAMFNIENPGNVSVKLFGAAQEGVYRSLIIGGYAAGAGAVDTLGITVGITGDNSVNFGGLSDYFFTSPATAASYIHINTTTTGYASGFKLAEAGSPRWYIQNEGGAGDLFSVKQQANQAVFTCAQDKTTTFSSDLTVNGDMSIQNTSATNSDSVLDISGNGTGHGILSLDGRQIGRIYDANNAIMFGFNAGEDTLYGTYLGVSCGNNNTGEDFTGAGYGCGHTNTGYRFTGFGRYAGHGNTGDWCAFGGASSGQSNTADKVAAWGYWSAYFNRGEGLSAFGEDTGFANTGASVTGTGESAIYNNTGDNVAVVGDAAGYNNIADQIVAIGSGSFSNFDEDSGNAQTFASGDVDIGTERITIAAHGFGSVGTYVNLKPTSTGTVPAGMTSGYVEQFEIISVDILEARTANITGGGTGTHTLTPKFAYTNSIAIGYDAEPDASNQCMIGNASLTNIKSAAGITLGGGLSTGAGHEYHVTAITATTTLTSAHHVVVCNAGANMEADLPAASGSGRVYHISRIDATGSTVEIDPNGTDAIDGGGAGVNVSLSQWDNVVLCDIASGQWKIL
ncbi:MAG: hypothetical protein KOO60_07415 [Gemmatimonadales bacterium]|nr:hypothetical protein [Gemmatimonadales bacterium]